MQVKRATFNLPKQKEPTKEIAPILGLAKSQFGTP